jgi:outer membrane cobalamin receptor
MRFSGILLSVLTLVVAASAAEIKIKVVDPQAAAIVGAQVVLLEKDTPLAVEFTSHEGVAVFRAGQGDYRVRVLAAGFAPQTAAVSAIEVSVQLHVAPVTDTVVVSATRTPVPGDAAGADVAALSASQLQTIQPVVLNEAMRFLPGAVVNTSGRYGSLGSMFVRGGDSRYNKVIVDGVTINEPGGTFDFGVVPVSEASRLEFVRGAQSTLYGSDAMTGVVQLWTRNGSTRTPELRFGADGGTFDTAHGYLSVAGARGRFDYNLFGDQFHSNGQGINDEYSNSSQGANLGVALNDWASLRLRVRHSDNSTGIQGEWQFDGAPNLPPDNNQWQHQNNLLGSLELALAGPSRWQHRLTGFDYRHLRTNVNGDNPDRIFDGAFHSVANYNRAGVEYEGNYAERSWAQATVGYEFEDENGFAQDLIFGSFTHGLRRNQGVYGQEVLTLRRLSIVAGARYVHNTTFGDKGVPRVALGYQLLRGGEILSGTQLRFSYATGIKEARLEEAFAGGPGTGIVPNPNLKAEENRSFEAGFQQGFLGGKYALTATYYNNLFHNQVDFAILDFNTFTGQYQNIDKSLAHGAEVEFKGRILTRLSLDMGYNYTSTQILEQPFFFDNLHEPGQPLIRRPKHSGSLLLTYLGTRWGWNLGTSVVGRRPDSDFLGLNIDHAAGYARVDAGGWYAVNSRITAYVNMQNLLDKHYQEVVGYPALGINFRAGVRFRMGGE